MFSCVLKKHKSYSGHCFNTVTFIRSVPLIICKLIPKNFMKISTFFLQQQTIIFPFSGLSLCLDYGSFCFYHHFFPSNSHFLFQLNVFRCGVFSSFLPFNITKLYNYSFNAIRRLLALFMAVRRTFFLIYVYLLLLKYFIWIGFVQKKNQENLSLMS